MTWVHYIFLGTAFALIDLMVLNNFDEVLLSLSFIASLLLIRSLRGNKNGIVFFAPIELLNYLYGDIRIFYFFVIFYFAILLPMKDEWMASKISEFKLCSVILTMPYVLLMIFRIDSWPNILASLTLSFLVYILSFLILKHDKRRILSREGF